MELRRSVVYGPVRSRRLGWSLGINLLPFDQKVCSFDCVYCQYGANRSRNKTHYGKSMGFLLPTDDLKQRMERGFAYHAARGVSVDYVTFSGNGEPTLHPGFREIVDHVFTCRDRYFPGRPLAIFSNADTLKLPGVKDGLMALDERFLKLDAGDEQTFLKVCRPEKDCRWNRIITGLKSLPSFKLQVAVVTGKPNNTASLISEAFSDLVQELQPREIHLYGIDRLPASPFVLPTDETRLLAVTNTIRKTTGIPIRILRDRNQWLERVRRDGEAPAFLEEEDAVARAEMRGLKSKESYGSIRRSQKAWQMV